MLRRYLLGIINSCTFDELKTHTELLRFYPCEVCEVVLETRRCNHLEFFKWIITESGNSIDVTYDGNFLVRLAAEEGSLDVIRWLVYESGQLDRQRIEFTERYTESETLRIIASECYGILYTELDSKADIISEIKAHFPKPELYLVYKALDSAGITAFEDRQKYFTSEAIQEAANLGVISTADHMDALLEKGKQTLRSHI